ncbi:hypothetical protein SAMN06298226_0433 [Nitrosovibrio sp. Nv4]|nr:hypothetical protein SAMN06298226_0433 [Nitrosovibrio sp. Nv4]
MLKKFYEQFYERADGSKAFIVRISVFGSETS